MLFDDGKMPERDQQRLQTGTHFQRFEATNELNHVFKTMQKFVQTVIFIGKDDNHFLFYTLQNLIFELAHSRFSSITPVGLYELQCVDKEACIPPYLIPLINSNIFSGLESICYTNTFSNTTSGFRGRKSARCCI